MASISYDYFENYALYEKIGFASQASDQYSSAVFGITQMAQILVLLIIYGFMLSKISWYFVGVIFLAIFISIVIAANITDKQLDYWRIHVLPEQRREEYFKNIFSNRVNHQMLQINRLFPFFSKKYEFFNDRERKNYLKLNLLSFSSEIATSILFLITFLVTALLTGQKVIANQLTIGYYSMVIVLLSNLFLTIKQFTMFMLNGNWYVKILDTYYEIIKLSDEQSNCKGLSQTAIEISHLNYKYPQSPAYALKDITTHFDKGMNIAVVGLNGSGKTTLISVILTLLNQYEGEYRNQNVKMTAILQDFGQYQLTVKENIELGVGGKVLSEEKIYEILKKIDLYDFIMEKPEGIYTKLGQLENGIELSKGQWQKLSIGRLLVNEEANVWILDEPVAYLDPLAEIDMYNFILNLSGNRLVFFISHRLGFARNADKIIVVDHGQIIEEGTHKELMNRENGMYARMFETQKEWYQ